MMGNFQEEAINKLGATAPELVNLVVSFRDLSEELPEGGNTSVGVFVVRAGMGLFFIPVVAKGNTVYPLDSIFDDQAKQFKPLTNTYVQRIIAAQTLELGAPSLIPKHVNTNPSIYNLIVPPRTGKYAYASHGLFTEFVAALPAHLKAKLSGSIENNHAFAESLGGVIKLPDMLESLAYNPVKPTVTISEPEVEIYTAKDADRNLTDAAIQDILNVGYHIKGDVKSPRIAVESGSAAAKFTKLSGIQEGGAFEAVLKDGTTINCMVPKRLKRASIADLPNASGVTAGMSIKKDHKLSDSGLVAVTEYGDYFTNPEVVMDARGIEVSQVASELYALSKVATIMDVEKGDVFLLVTEEGVAGPFRANSVSITGTMAIINSESPCEGYRRVTITASTGFKGKVFSTESEIIVPSHATVIELGRNIDSDLETSITGAQNRRDLNMMGLLESQASIRSHDNGFFSINGQEVGNEADLVKMLIVGHGIAKQASLGFVKSAKENKVVTILMSKKASDMGAITPGDIPEYGQSPVPGDDSLFDKGQVETAIQTRDPGIVESTIISQFLQDPSMLETISSYLPIINESMDKIGRTLLLLRINGDMETAEDIASLVTSLRNTYKLLGDNTAKLEYMVNGSSEGN